MERVARCAIGGLALLIGAAGVSISLSAWADPPGGFKHEKGHGGDEERGGRPPEGFGFRDQDRMAVQSYFADSRRHGGCPPGLAKKQNGCMPPGQAKRWLIGAPLPPDLVLYSLPPQLVVQLTPPPLGYRYVRVASDILMIAAGTGMVASAIEDLGR